MNRSAYNIATATDSGYFVPMYVMLLSLFENNVNLNLGVYILYTGLTVQQRNAVEQLANEYSNKVNWIAIENDDVKSFYISEYISVACYYRIYLPELLPESISRILYLDADIVVAGSIEELLRTAVGDNPLLAVREAIPHDIQRLGIPDGYDYFNSGVLLINLNEWRKCNYHIQIADNIKKKRSAYLMYDQDVLNAFFYDKVSYLHPKWNHQTGFYHLSKKQLEARYRVDADILLNEPVIIHFIGVSKPWQYLCTHPYKPLFLQYLSKTPFAGFAESATIRRLAKKTLLRIKHKLDKISKSFLHTIAAI